MVMKRMLVLCLGLGLFLSLSRAWADDPTRLSSEMAKVDAYVQQAWSESDIPGLALAVVDNDQILVKGYGLARLDTKQPVTPDTLFELGSCTKAFTGLALARVRADAGLDFAAPVARVLPLFYGLHQGKQQNITLADILHHTSGIPAATIMTLPAGDQDYALTQTTLGVSGLELEFVPGSQFSYSTVNYDVAAQILQVISGMDYAEYLNERVLKPLGLRQTLVGCQALAAPSHPEMASGYKVGFTRPQAYLPPVFRGNFPAGYVISNARDMVLWLRLQMGLEDNPLAPLILQTHVPNRQTPAGPDDYYALGWYVTSAGVIHHDGVNPTFTAFVGFDPASKKGVAVLTNYNSALAGSIGWGALAIMLGRDPRPPRDTFDYPLMLDKKATIACLVLGSIGLALALFCLGLLWRVLVGERRFTPPTAWRFLLLGLFMVLTPVVIYLVAEIPGLLMGATWEAMAVWGPISLSVAAKLALAVWFLGLILINLVLLFPRRRFNAPA